MGHYHRMGLKYLALKERVDDKRLAELQKYNRKPERASRLLEFVGRAKTLLSEARRLANPQTPISIKDFYLFKKGCIQLENDYRNAYNLHDPSRMRNILPMPELGKYISMYLDEPMSLFENTTDYSKKQVWAKAIKREYKSMVSMLKVAIEQLSARDTKSISITKRMIKMGAIDETVSFYIENAIEAVRNQSQMEYPFTARLGKVYGAVMYVRRILNIPRIRTLKNYRYIENDITTIVALGKQAMQLGNALNKATRDKEPVLAKQYKDKCISLLISLLDLKDSLIKGYGNIKRVPLKGRADNVNTDTIRRYNALARPYQYVTGRTPIADIVADTRKLFSVLADTDKGLFSNKRGAEQRAYIKQMALQLLKLMNSKRPRVRGVEEKIDELGGQLYNAITSYGEMRARLSGSGS